MIMRNNSTIKFINNHLRDPFQEKRPPPDFSPMRFEGGVFSVRASMLAAAISTTTAFISSVFTLFGTDVFKIGDFLSKGKIQWVSMVSLGILVSSLILLLALIKLNFTKVFHSFSGQYEIVSGKIVYLPYKRVCPYCRGTMEPKFQLSKIDKNQMERKWVCQKEPNLHQLDFDWTQIDEAIKDGKLAFLFDHITF